MLFPGQGLEAAGPAPGETTQSGVEGQSAVAQVLINRVIPLGGEVRVNLDTLTQPLGQRIEREDIVQTGRGSWVQLLVWPAGVIWVGPESQVLLTGGGAGREPDAPTFRLYRGSLRARVAGEGGKKQDIRLESGELHIELRGTDFFLSRAELGVTEVRVIEGVLEVYRPDEGESWVQVDQGFRFTISPEGGWGSWEMAALEVLTKDTEPTLRDRAPGGGFLPPSMAVETLGADHVEFEENAFSPPAWVDETKDFARGPWTIELPQ